MCLSQYLALSRALNKGWLLPRWNSGKEFACQCKRCGFDPWVGKILWSRKWQPTLVFLVTKFHGQKRLVGYSPWGCKESDKTEHTHTHVHVAVSISSVQFSRSVVPDSATPWIAASQASLSITNERLRGQESAYNAGDTSLVLGLGRSPGGEYGNPLWHSNLENPMDGEVWWAIVHRVAKSQTQLKWLSMYPCSYKQC